MKQIKVAVVADSTISLPQAVTSQFPLYVVPMTLVLGEKEYRDGVDIGPEEFYRILRETTQLPKTSTPSPGAFLEAFTTASKDSKRILCITLSAKLSSTYSSALTAAQLAQEALPDVEIQVMDSRTAGGAEALIALKAAQTAKGGGELAHVAQAAQDVAQKVQFIGILDTLYYVWKGGHIPKVALWVGALLNVKPILDISLDKIQRVDQPRTRERALKRLLEILQRRADGKTPLHVIVMHANAPQEADSLRRQILSLFPACDPLVTPFTPVIGAHTGPGLLGIAFYQE